MYFLLFLKTFNWISLMQQNKPFNFNIKHFFSKWCLKMHFLRKWYSYVNWLNKYKQTNTWSKKVFVHKQHFKVINFSSAIMEIEKVPHFFVNTNRFMPKTTLNQSVFEQIFIYFERIWFYLNFFIVTLKILAVRYLSSNSVLSDGHKIGLI